MTNASRSLSMPARFGSHVASARARRRIFSLTITATAALALSIAAAPAQAIVEEVASNTVGLQPRNVEQIGTAGETPETFDNFNGNPVLHSNSTYVVYWDPTDHYHGDWQHLIDTFMHDVGAASGALDTVFTVNEQYTDKTNQPANYRSTYKGAYTDTTKYPLSGCTAPNPFEEVDQIVVEGKPTALCLTNAQLQTELQKFISQHSLPKGMGTIYYLLTPPGVTVCLDAGTATGHCSDYFGSVGGSSYQKSFCSYHSAINPGGLASGDSNTVLYGAIPWTAGTYGDPHINALADLRPGSDCQDGGFDASSKKPVEPKEKKKEKNAAEKEAFAKMDPEEKEKVEEAEALEEPHQQEPNQGKCPTADGGCDRGLADLIINEIAVEQQNIVTNPLLNAWQDSEGNEATDECRNFFAPTLSGTVTAEPVSISGTLHNQEINGGIYYLNNAFDHAESRLPWPGVPCMHGIDLDPQFTAPNPVNSGELVGFNGMESDITLDATIAFPPAGERKTTYATYTWDFGDGTPKVTGFAPGAPSGNSAEGVPCEAPWLPPCAASAFHAYQYGGTYDVTLTVKDVGDNVASIANSITVAGPPPPAPPAPPNPGSPGTGTPSSTGTGSTGKGTGGPHPDPVATQAVSPQKIPSVLRGGLVVRYSVNEQVAGRFEVLIASSLARRLGLHGAPATGLAKGMAPQTVIAKAVLVTTKGGHSTFKIKFSKATAARLRKVKNVSLMVRLVVHNAASGVTSVLNTVKLTH